MARQSLDVRVKRVYDLPAEDDGARVLVDRLWPRGLSKPAAKVDRWLRDVAPSTALRQWYRHDPEKWSDFVRRYRAELEAAPEPLAELRQLAADGPVTLLFASSEFVLNNAVALQAFLREGGRPHRARRNPAGLAAARSRGKAR